MFAVACAQAQTDQTSILVYQAAFFADARPNTAYDMIGRLPAFTFDDGTSARGFAGTAGNVLIDGQRPTAKTDDLLSILSRIPASDVDRIEVIRGGAPGIDSRQAQTTVLIRDGETIVIGGLISDHMENTVFKIPLLGDIPILGFLFRSKHLARTRTELLIFVTPKILAD